MSSTTKKSINIGLLIVYILLVLIIVPSPFYDKLDDYVHIQNDQWKFIVVKEGQYTRYYGSNFPIFTIDRSGTMQIITTPATKAYIEAKFNVPQRGETFSYFFSSNLYSFTTLIDAKGTQHTLNEIDFKENKPYWDRYRGLYLKQFDISQFVGQNITIRIEPIAAPIDAKPTYSYHHYYAFMKIDMKQYTAYDNFLLFLNIVTKIILFSLIVGFIVGYSGLSLFPKISNKFHILVKESYSNLFSNEDKWYIKKWFIRYYLKIVFLILDKSLDFADKIHDIKLQTSIKTSIMVGLPVIVIYTTAIIVYFIIIIILAILMLALIIWVILEILGGSPSGGSIGRGSSSGSGGGSSSSSSSNSALSNEKKDNNYQPFFGQEIIGDIISPGEKCSNCEGSGKCPNCYGTGNPDAITDIARSLSPIYTEKQKCDECKGSGKCVVCYGKGYLK